MNVVTGVGQVWARARGCPGCERGANQDPRCGQQRWGALEGGFIAGPGPLDGGGWRDPDPGTGLLVAKNVAFVALALTL